ncbi:hypothetical protein Ddye_004507 [Dipteronia dyeriana]|uniref:Bifunctional inhibitor/plant lipid transfer protein/seed storage helical domain-containing protein n=1 Tax=Dipteronia dyeriana TaxID=168575 RepID=A0AAD9XWA1_9ROSI|nr:hypothetical protein Ddye_004507 [Dipteronia dyeriana]
MEEILPSSVVSPGVSKRRGVSKSMGLMKGHNMILTSSRACEKMKQQNSGVINKVTWNLEDGIVKMFEKVLAVMVVVVAAALLMVEPSKAIISCREVNSLLIPCLNYKGGSVGIPSKSCCNNVKYLTNRALFPGDRQVVFQCIKDQEQQFQDPASITKKASEILGFCRVNFVSVPENPNFNCNR